VNQIDAVNRRVSVTIGSPEQNTPEAERTPQADHLVIALGGVNDFRSAPSAQQHALTLKSLLDAALVRNRVLAMRSRWGAIPAWKPWLHSTDSFARNCAISPNCGRIRPDYSYSSG
jgi:NADH dehydrogenase FAD-containing subunit